MDRYCKGQKNKVKKIFQQNGYKVLVSDMLSYNGALAGPLIQSHFERGPTDFMNWLSLKWRLKLNDASCGSKILVEIIFILKSFGSGTVKKQTRKRFIANKWVYMMPKASANCKKLH